MKKIKTAAYKKMAARQSWKDEPGELFISLDWYDEAQSWYDTENDKELPESVMKEILAIKEPATNEPIELIINFVSTGYSDSGNPYGPVETSYAPEGEDERSLEGVFVENIAPLSNQTAQIIFDIYHDQIDQIDMNIIPNDGPDRSDFEEPRW